jgi:hypothetical protein
MKLQRKSDGAIINLDGEWSVTPSEEQWVDVTADCALIPDDTSAEFALEFRGMEAFRDYRLRKVQIAPSDTHHWQWGFIVEKSEP